MNRDLILVGFALCILYLLYQNDCHKKTIENMTETSSSTTVSTYDPSWNNLQAIQNLADISRALQEGGLTIPGNVTIQGSLNVEGKELEEDEVALNVTGNSTVTGSLSYLPIGTIIIWSGAVDAVPDGWALCNGENDTPNLAGRFVLGSGTPNNTNTYDGNGGDDAGNGTRNLDMDETGGKRTHTLTKAELANHYHVVSLKEYSDDGSGHSGKDVRTHDDSGDVYRRGTTSVGGDQPHNNMPPYYVLAYIMRIR